MEDRELIQMWQTKYLEAKLEVEMKNRRIGELEAKLREMTEVCYAAMEKIVELMGKPQD